MSDGGASPVVDVDIDLVRSRASVWDAVLSEDHEGHASSARCMSVETTAWLGASGGAYDAVRLKLAELADQAAEEMAGMALALVAACHHYEETDRQYEYEFDNVG